jgi:antitoxin (DNA-binding transcriptional repressor) of toxin-antitoxin stability system
MKKATVGIRDAKAHLSNYLKILGQGAEVILTDRGIPVDTIVPLRPEERSLEQRLSKLEAEGVLGRQPDRNQRKQTRQFPLAVPESSAQHFHKHKKTTCFVKNHT